MLSEYKLTASPTSTRSPPETHEYSQVTTTIVYSSPTGSAGGAVRRGQQVAGALVA